MYALLTLLSILGWPLRALANPACAVCTIAVGASLGIARKLGFDDNIVGLWMGAFLTLVGYWAILWFDKKQWNFRGRNILLMLLSIASVGVVYLKTLVYQPQPILFLYLDPFLFSVLLGATALFGSNKLYQWMKQRHGGHAHFPFEKVVLPVGILIILSVYLNYVPLTAGDIALQSLQL